MSHDRSRLASARSVVTDPENRDPFDFYATPAWGTEALLRVERFPLRVWEPACGDGAMSHVLERTRTVVSTDLIDRGYGTAPVDFLQTTHAEASAVVTNPPFRLAEEFLHHALSFKKVKKVAFLCRLAWLEGGGRGRSVYNGATPLVRVWVFSDRLPTARRNSDEFKHSGGKGGMIAFAWYVWDKDEYRGHTALGHVSKGD